MLCIVLDIMDVFLNLCVSVQVMKCFVVESGTLERDRQQTQWDRATISIWRRKAFYCMICTVFLLEKLFFGDLSSANHMIQIESQVQSDGDNKDQSGVPMSGFIRICT